MQPKITLSEDMVNSLNAFQHIGVVHPYTCVNHSQFEPLEARTDGLWHCIHCDYVQLILRDIDMAQFVPWDWLTMFSSPFINGIMESCLRDYHARTGRPIGPTS